MSDIVDRDGKPTTVLCIAPTGYEKVCRTKEELEQFFIAYPSCQIYYERESDD